MPYLGIPHTVDLMIDRSDWPVSRTPLSRRNDDDLSGSTTAAERLAMMWPLALEAWLLTGAPLPSYERAEAEVRVIEAQSS